MPRLPGCCHLHDNRVRARRRSERVVSSSETKSPRPHRGRAPGHRRWNSSGKAADIAGGPCPGPGSADASAPRACRQAAPGESWRSAPSCSLPATPPGFPRFQNTFIIPQGSSGPMEQSLFPTPFPLQPLMCFLSPVGLPILHRGRYSDAYEYFIYMESC